MVTLHFRTAALVAALLFSVAWENAAMAQHPTQARPAPRQSAVTDATSTTTTGSTVAAAATSAAHSAVSALEKRIKALESKLKTIQQGQDDLQVKQIVMEGRVEAEAPQKEAAFKLKTFVGHSRALQSLNPEMSVTGDLGGVFYWSNGKEYGSDERSGFRFRGLGFHFQSALDPFSFMKAAVSVSPEGVEFGEAYVVWTDVAGIMNIMAGKFRQQLGVINRWHKHALDQYDYPLMLQEPFGEGGLNQLGVSFQFLIPHFIADANELYLQITNGMNKNAFAGDYFSLPTTLLHFKNYWDLSRNTYLELGLTGIVGFNNHRGELTKALTKTNLFTDTAGQTPFNVYDANGNPVDLAMTPTATIADPKIRVTAFGGADFTIQWEPVNQAKYHNVIWRTEFLYGYKQLPDDTFGGKQTIHWMGGYSYLQAKLSRQIEVGTRVDLVQPFDQNNSRHYIYQIAPYMTWWQSPWAKIRLEYNYMDGDLIKGAHRAIVQVVFAAGPHKHDRY